MGLVNERLSPMRSLEAPEGTFEFRSRVAEIEPVSRVPPPKPWP